MSEGPDFKEFITHVFEGKFECDNFLVPFEVEQNSSECIHVHIGNEIDKDHFVSIHISINSDGNIHLYTTGFMGYVLDPVHLGKILTKYVVKEKQNDNT